MPDFPATDAQPPGSDVLGVDALDPVALQVLLAEYGLQLVRVDPGQTIPGSFWGDSEAGLIGRSMYVRPDTPVHSLLHETSHYICMDSVRRRGLNTDAGGDYDEENAVCYLQILLAARLPPMDPARMMADMDSWGYSFRLGSARRWFEEDAEDARYWLLRHALIDEDGRPTGKIRNQA
jgi:hypothetical protein